MLLIKTFIFFLFFAGCTALHPPEAYQRPLSEFKIEKPVRIALVLGGGGSKGMAHLGAIKELERAGIRPDLIIGSSAGAIIGAFYADDPSLEEAEQLFLNLKKSDLLDTSFFGSRFGLVKGEKLQNFIQKNLRSNSFADLKTPLIVVATDLFTGDTVELSQGEISSAINASCALPGLFKPVLLHDRYLVDGGVSSPLPVEIAKKYGAELIIAIDVSEELPSSKPYHLFGIAKRGIEISYRKLVSQSLEKADVAIKMSFQDIGMFSEHLNQEMYEKGQLEARKALVQIKERLER